MKENELRTVVLAEVPMIPIFFFFLCIYAALKIGERKLLCVLM